MKPVRIITELVFAAVLLIELSGCGLSKDTKAAEAEVERFHQHWNANEFQAVYDEAHMQFRNAQPATALVATLERLKKTYGNLKSTKKRSWGFNSDNGVTDIKLSYDSAYDHGAAVEEFLFRMTDAKPLLLGYDIMTPENAAKREEERKAAREEKRKAEEAKRKAEREAKKKP